MHYYYLSGLKGLIRAYIRRRWYSNRASLAALVTWYRIECRHSGARWRTAEGLQ